ncbi:phage antirepressor KilAC domain-containing protein [Escherichia coli]|uniref:Phage antirepressor KilAC domain-containing protein n=3 Tax=Escherichia coli TaxID=562 RepID=A0AAW7V2J7_ECOLX|nr:phage antirepressor KilAC domain-containing protein [Escherichia coli]EAZ1177208.1 phage antirepressor Ant [Salmonella enterica]EIE6147667.1 phage antirepressor KilAC domain-containing protein [Escherichia coli O26]EIG3664158.1 phage antirepressor KilAC domain-containing protein [Escherichia coli O26:H11]EER9187249.1 phage antirepressor Ant [Escherichia coli]EEU9355851.1 phage antirepressor Ant [Escherichia coli]
MRTSLVTREEMIEAIEQHTACISTRDIPGVIANYFMITKQLYRRKDKHAVHRILLTDIREYLLEQGHLNYATVAAEARKEAHRMKATNVKSEKIYAPSVQESELVVVQNQPDEIPVLEWQGVRVVTTETLARGYGVDEANIRNNLSRNLDRFEEGKHYFLLTALKLREFKNRVTGSYSVGKNARSLTLWTERGAARMSKIVDTNEAWAFFEKLEDSYFRQKEQQPVAIPQTLPEALRLAAELAEQKQLLEQKAHQLNQQLVAAAPKVDFADRVSVAKGILIGNFAKVVGLKQNALFAWLRENGILIASGGRKNVPFQQYINAGYFTVKEVVLDDEDGYQIRLTPQLTGKGQQWLTRKLLDAGLLKPVAAE